MLHPVLSELEAEATRLSDVMQLGVQICAIAHPETMARWSWRLDAIGRVTTDTGQVVFRAGFGSAVRKTVAYVADF